MGFFLLEWKDTTQANYPEQGWYPTGFSYRQFLLPLRLPLSALSLPASIAPSSPPLMRNSRAAGTVLVGMKPRGRARAAGAVLRTP